MTRVLVVYYSQSGETARVAKLFIDELTAAGANVVVEEIRPLAPYPYPWKSIVRFFDAMPDAVLGSPAGLAAARTGPDERFDLIVLAYPVWFLSPATPVQAFFKSPGAKVMRQTDVITVSVSRAMWQRASLAMNRLLAEAGAAHCDNIAVTHQGSPLATLVSTPRALLFGKSDRLFGVFPNAGLAGDDVSRLRHLAALTAARLMAGHPPGTPYLRGEPVVAVKRWLAVPELLAWYCFHGSARTIRALGSFHPALRTAGVVAFALILVILIVVGLPLTLLVAFLAAPVISSKLDAYILRLAEPGGARQ